MSIIIRNIHKSFEENHVLKGIDFEFEAGKVNIIIGASGSGKSVLTKCIVGLIEPNQGDVYFDNVSFWKQDVKTKKNIRKNFGMLFQYSALFDSMTVEENVGFPLRMFDTKFTESQIEKRVKECLERVNLHNVEKKYPSELSGGMKKRVGIARAIALNPKYLFCDEPNSGLDPQTSSIIDKLILDLTNEYKTTTIVISHDMNSVLNIGDKIMFIHKGKKEWEGHKTEMLHSDSKPLKEFLFASELIVNQYHYELSKK